MADGSDDCRGRCPETRRPRRSRSTAMATSTPTRQRASQRAFHRWERMIDTGIAYYVKGLDCRPAAPDHDGRRSASACWR